MTGPDDTCQVDLTDECVHGELHLMHESYLLEGKVLIVGSFTQAKWLLEYVSVQQDIFHPNKKTYHSDTFHIYNKPSILSNGWLFQMKSI